LEQKRLIFVRYLKKIVALATLKAGLRPWGEKVGAQEIRASVKGIFCIKAVASLRGNCINFVLPMFYLCWRIVSSPL
jgi:hypothetical protein